MSNFQSAPISPMLGGTGTVQALEHTIEYSMGGAGAPLILLPSPFQSRMVYEQVFEALCQTNLVYAMDWPGWGKSTVAEELMTVEYMARVLCDFVEAITHLPVDVCAASFGAIYALQAALSRPELFVKLILLSPGGVTKQMPLSFRLLASPIGKQYSLLLGKSLAFKILTDGYFDLTAYDEERIAEAMDVIEDRRRVTALAAALMAFDEAPVMARLQEYPGPCLVVWGVEDRWRPKELAARFRALPAAELELVRNCGHFICEEKPAQLGEIVTEFLCGEENAGQV